MFVLLALCLFFVFVVVAWLPTREAYALHDSLSPSPPPPSTFLPPRPFSLFLPPLPPPAPNPSKTYATKDHAVQNAHVQTYTSCYTSDLENMCLYIILPIGNRRMWMWFALARIICYKGLYSFDKLMMCCVLSLLMLCVFCKSIASSAFISKHFM